MIDTDKYEGHYEGPWEYSADSQCIFGRQNEETGNWPVLVEFPAFLHDVSTGEEYNNHPEVLKHTRTTPNGKVYHEKSFWWGDALPRMFANLKLMADAPLLLEEVKRLHLIEMSVQDFLDERIDSLEFCRNMREMGVIE